MKVNRIVPASLIALALAVPLALVARADGDALPSTPSAEQVTTSKLVYGLLSDSRYAYRPRPLDAAMPGEIFDKYLEALDGSKLFFTAQDVARFKPYRAGMGESVRSGDLEPAYTVFALYQQRVADRVAYARSLLNQDIFGFTGDDRWNYDREDAPWAADKAELDKLWKQSVRNDWLRLKLAGKKPDEIRKTLDRRYLNMANNIAALNQEDAFQSFLNAYTATVDPHTDYMNPRTAKLFNQSMSLSLEGIGAQLTKQDDVVVIRELIAGGPAMLSGKFKVGDRIVAVGQGASGPMEDVVGWRLDDVVEKIKGAKGTQVRLDVIPGEATLDSKPVRIALNRARIKLEEQAAKSEILDVPADAQGAAKRIGVIKLPAFYQDFEGRRSRNGEYTSATRDVARILEQFKTQRIDGVVLDLRSNGGGSLNEAIELTGLFIDKGPVVQVREAGGRIAVEGDRYGHVKLTIAQFFLPGGSSTQNKGVVPDIAFPVTVDASEYGESTYDNALEWRQIAAVPHQRYGNFSALLPKLDALHGARIAKDKEFSWWSEDVAEFRAEREKKYISLNEAERRAERDRDEAKRKQRQAERRTLGLDLDPLAESSADDGLQASERNVAEDAAREKAAEKRPDPLLRESAAILADAVRLLNNDRQLSAQVLPESTAPGTWTQ